jgi:hypothetical protein
MSDALPYPATPAGVACCQFHAARDLFFVAVDAFLGCRDIAPEERAKAIATLNGLLRDKLRHMDWSNA